MEDPEKFDPGLTESENSASSIPQSKGDLKSPEDSRKSSHSNVTETVKVIA